MTLCIETPSRPACSRSTLTSMRGPPSCASEATSRSAALLRSRARQFVGPFDHLGGVGAGQRVLILRAAGACRNLDVLHRLEIDRHAGDAGDLFLQPLDDGSDAGDALLARLQADGEPSGVGRGVERADADQRDHAGDVRIGAHDRFDLRLPPLHFGERDIDAGFGNGGDLPGVLQRQEAFRDDDVERRSSSPR